MSIEEVQPRIYRIPSILGPRRFAQWLVVGDERLLLVDSGIDGTIAEHVVPALAELGRRAGRDHRRRRSPTPTSTTTAATASCGAWRRSARDPRVGARPAVDRVVGRDRARALRLVPRPRARLRRGDVGVARERGRARHAARRHGRPTASVLDLGGIEVEIVALPGHSPGHLGVLHRESGTAIVMDAVLERGLYTTDDELISPPPYGSVSDLPRARSRRLRERRARAARDEPLRADRGRAAVDRVPRRDRKLRRRPRRVRRRRARVASRSRSRTTGARPTLRSGRSRRWRVELARSVGAHLEHAVDEGRAVRAPGRGGRAVWARPELVQVVHIAAPAAPVARIQSDRVDVTPL